MALNWTARRWLPHVAPGTASLLQNFVAFQLAWFAVVVGAARGQAGLGMAVLLLVVARHLWQAPRPAQEAWLVASLCLLGLLAEMVNTGLGYFVYIRAEAPDAARWPWPPYWMVGLWGLLATSLNVTLRWLKRRVWLSALLGAVLGPASIDAGLRLGAGHYVNQPLALASLALLWFVLMPVVMALSERFDGMRNGQMAGARQ